MFDTLLVANRGEIACRIIRTAHRLGMRTVAVYSDPDRHARHVLLADAAVAIGPAAATDSYLNQAAVLDAAKRSGAQAIHPGYGFLAENAAFAAACAEAGLVFVGPTSAVMALMGAKDQAKRAAKAAGVPVVPGYDADGGDAALTDQAAGVGYPLLIKPVAGGGGKGMRRVDRFAQFASALAAARREAQAAFGNDAVLLERYLERSRHIEVQVFGDSRGNLVHLFERDCSLQRRHQKVIEEAPSAGVDEALRGRLVEAAVSIARSVAYQGAGTVEFIVDEAGNFYFLEMNTRLQVEHPVTEMITGLDLVEWQLRVAAGEPLPLAQDAIERRGHAIEVRLYAEDPAAGFLPCVGQLQRLLLSAAGAGVRVDSGVVEGDRVTPYYDPLVAKVIAWGENREAARRRLLAALRASVVTGVATNLGLLETLLSDPTFVGAGCHTQYLDEHLDALITAPRLPVPLLLAAALTVMVQEQRAAANAAIVAGDPNSPWAASGGWSLSGPVARRFAFAVGGAEQELWLQVMATDEVRVGVGQDGTCWRYQAQGPRMLLHDGQVELRLHAWQSGAQIEVSAESGRYRMTLVAPWGTLSSLDETVSALAAPMAGKVIEVNVAAGDRVTKGDSLMVVEAMKMEHRILAPHDGTIAELFAGVGDFVEGAATLARFAQEGDPGDNEGRHG